MLKKSLIIGFIVLAFPFSTLALGTNQESEIAQLLSRVQALYQQISQIIASQGADSMVAAASGASKFVVGDRVKATDNLNVRSMPSLEGDIVGVALKGMMGAVASGPQSADGYTWWQVKWDGSGFLPGATGWSVEDYLQKISTGTAPSCTLKANPESVQPGGSSILTLTSQNATSATIDQGVGAVAVNGTTNVTNITTTKTYTATVTGAGGSAACSATVAVQTPGNQSCTFNGQTILHGGTVTAYQSSSVPAGGQCVSQTRTCNNGTLSGSYQYPSCSVQSAGKFSIGDKVKATDTLNVREAPSLGASIVGKALRGTTGVVTNGPQSADGYTWWQVKWDGSGFLPGVTGWSAENYLQKITSGTDSCTLDGVTVLHGQSRTFYSAKTVQAPNTCSVVSQSRTCTDGTLSGSSLYQYASCEQVQTQAPTCTLKANPESVQPGGSSVLTLSSQNATSATIDQGIGAVPVNGTKQITNITATKTYTASVTGAGGTAQCSAIVSVQSASIPSGITLNNVTSQWNRGTTLLSNFLNLYNGHIIRDVSDASYPYKMWFMGWAAYTCNNPGGFTPGTPCDAIFYARSANGLSWQVYKGDSGGTPQYDTTMTASLWKPVITAGSTYYDGVHNGDPSVVKIGADYYMVYSATGNDLDGKASGQAGDTDQDFQGIMAAVSTDGIHWQKATKPYFVSPTEAGKQDNLNGNMYHRPSLMYENGKFRMWFDYWNTTGGLVMGYAELPLASPTQSAFLAGTFTGVNVGDNPQMYAFPNPDVIKVNSTYYAYGDPPQQYDQATQDPWQARKITEATSPDGIHWTTQGYVDAESGCAANHVPEAYYYDGTIYVTTGCQKGGTPYDFQYKEIRRMSKQLSAPVDQSCTLDGVTKQNGESYTFYSAKTVQAPNTCTAVSQVRTCSKGIWSGDNQYQYKDCAVISVPAPTGLQASCKPAGDEVTLSWNASPGAANYGIRIIQVGSQIFHKIEEWFQGTTFTASVVPGTNYSWWVHANPAVGTLGDYTMGTAFTCVAPAVAPTNLQATCTDSTHVTLTWDAMPGAIHYHVRLIEPGSSVFYREDNGILVATYSTNVVAGKTYNWWVHANFDPAVLGPYTSGTAFKCGG
ncbi:MAG: hypothetical protein G01um10148_16 [Parcubacteria group bacterium Gr01-1014_8]|nr:MAG: hypothetical protein G01um10148_16 [Parcubacteria group bacterium Gr01-1014_8]